jgi:hypothetical protein
MVFRPKGHNVEPRIEIRGNRYHLQASLDGKLRTEGINLSMYERSGDNQAVERLGGGFRMPGTAAQFLANIIVGGDTVCVEGGGIWVLIATSLPLFRLASRKLPVQRPFACALRDAFGMHTISNPAKARDRDDWWWRSGNAAGGEKQIDR